MVHADVQVVITLHVVLVFTDSLPILPTLLSITAHLVYLSNFSSSWPYISLTSPRFLASCALVVADHFTWFYHFAAKAKEAKRFRQPKYRYGAGAYNDGPAFMDVAAFFAICVWFVPLFLFLSLSANDNALPSFGTSLGVFDDSRQRPRRHNRRPRRQAMSTCRHRPVTRRRAVMRPPRWSSRF